MKLTPPLKWPGGKTYLQHELHALAPPHVHRVHVFAGGLGEFWNWPCEGVSEVVNDVDGWLVNFYRVLADPVMFGGFKSRVWATPLSEELWTDAAARVATKQAHGGEPNGIADAVDFFVLVRQSREGKRRDWATITRNRTRRGMNEQVSAWLSAVDGLPEVHARLSRVAITCERDFCKLINRQDGPNTLFYCDPPYLHDTRVSTNDYGQHEMSKDDHDRLLTTLSDIEGKFMLSGYRSSLYDSYARIFGWQRADIDHAVKASNAKNKGQRTECVWMNY